MCHKYFIGSSLETLKNRYNVEARGIDLNTGQIISQGDQSLIITQENPKELILSKFGLTPAWSKKPMQIINARAEGDKNPDNNPAFAGSKAIFLNKACQKPLFFRRCLVIADAFIEWSIAATHQPYLIFLRNHERPFTMAGLYEIWIDPATLEKQHSFTIITVPGNTLMQKLPYTRMPVILEKGREFRWLKPDLSLRGILGQLQIFPSGLMNAYPIDPRIKNSDVNDKQLIKPIGEKLLVEDKQSVPQKTTRNSYHNSLNRHSPDNTQPSWGEISSQNRALEH